MKKIISIILLSIITINLTSCEKETSEIKKYYKTTVTQSGSISLEDNFVGSIESEKVTVIGSKNGGKIIGFYVKEGERVSKGQLIAKIDSIENNTQAKYQDKLLDKLSELSESIGKTFDSQKEIIGSNENQTNIGIKGIEKIISQTEKSSSGSLETISSQIESGKDSLETAKIELEKTKNIFDTNEKNIYSNAKNAITASMIIDTNSIKYIDELFGVINTENDDKNDNFQDFLGAHNLIQKSETINEFKEIYKKYLEYKKDYEDKILNKDGNNEEIELLLKLGIDFNNSLRNHLKNVYETVDNSIPNSSSFSTDTITNHKNKISLFGKDIENSLISVNGNYTLGLKGSIENIENLKNEKEKTLSLLQKKVDLSEKSLNIIGKNYEEVSLGNNIKITDLENKKDLSIEKLIEIEKTKKNIENQKNSKENELELEKEKIKLSQEITYINIDNSIIRAPFDGVISKKFIDIGGVLSPSQALVEISEDKDIKASFFIGDEALKKLIINSKVKIKTEGYDYLQNGIIKNIYPFKDEISKKTKIEVKLESIKDIKIGSLARLYTEDKSKNGIIIPNSAIIDNYMIPAVLTIKTQTKNINKNIAEQKQIKILFQNNDFSIIEGVDEGETIITEGKENIFDGEELNK